MTNKINHIFYKLLRTRMFILMILSGSISYALNTFEQQQTLQQDTSEVTPKTYNEDFKENYDASEYVYEQEKNENWFSRFVDWLEAWIQDVFDFDSRKKAADFLDDATNIFYVILIILVVFFIVRAVMNGEGRWVFGKRSDKKMVKYEDVETDIHNVDFKKLISQATGINNYRLAIRYQYLDMLKKMSASEIISYDPEKTNLDYTYEIKNDGIREQFQYTSYVYNYVWYGEFSIDKTQYEQVQESFSLLLKNMAA